MKGRPPISNKDNNKSSFKNIGLLIGLLIVGIYLLGTVIFSYIALPGTFLNGRDISYASKQEALDTANDDFGLEVVGRDGKSLIISPADIDYEQELPSKAKIDQNPFSWPVAFATGRKEYYDFEYKIFYNQEKLDKLIADSALVNGVTEPKDAQIAMKNGEFVIEDEIEGNKIKETELKEEIIKAINTKEDSIALSDDFYYEPKIRRDSEVLQNVIADSNKVNDMTISFNFNGFDFKLEGQSLIDLLDLTSTGYEPNYDKIYEYVNYLADQTDTYGKQRKFNATGIGEVIVGPGVYGFKLDKDATVDQIYELINTRQSGDIEPVYSNVAFERTADGSDIGDTYVELDISRQRFWYYKDGQLIIESDVVTGLPTEEWASNVGVGAILNKVADTKLVGFEFDGVNKYETPVDYWIPTGWDGEGFHDAPWKGAFGGDIYLQNGSHGCYNLPPSVAKELFETVETLTPVIVYESSTNNSPPMTY